MACKEFEELILRDLDGEMTNPDRIKLRDHMGGCTACRKERETFAKIDEALKKTTSPAPSRRDFAGMALEKAEAVLASAPRRVRRRISVAVYATLGAVATLVALAAISGTVYLGTRPVNLPPDPKIELPRTEEKTDPVKKDPIKTEQRVTTATPDDLKKIFKFGEIDPVDTLVNVNLKLAGNVTPTARIDLLEEAAAALLDGYAGAMAYGDASSAADYASGLQALLEQGITPILQLLRDPAMAEFLTGLGDRFSDRANQLLKFSQELGLDQKFEMQTVIGYCSQTRDAAREAVRRR